MPYEDFKKSSYAKTRRKLSKIREMLQRIYGDYKNKSDRLNLITHKIHKFNEITKLETDDSPLKEKLRGEKCDLTITDFSILEMFSSYYTFRVIVKNIGTVRAKNNSNLKVILGSQINNLTISSLNPNESQTFLIDFTFDAAGLSKEYTATAIVDSSHVVDETDEDNNEITFLFTAKEPLVIPPGYGAVFFHLHNEEDKEINRLLYLDHAISGVGGATISWDSFAEHYDINSGISPSHQHNEEVFFIPVGLHTFHGRFNGMHLTQDITILENNTHQITFEFPRTQHTDIPDLLYDHYQYTLIDNYVNLHIPPKPPIFTLSYERHYYWEEGFETRVRNMYDITNNTLYEQSIDISLVAEISGHQCRLYAKTIASRNGEGSWGMGSFTWNSLTEIVLGSPTPATLSYVLESNGNTSWFSHSYQESDHDDFAWLVYLTTGAYWVASGVANQHYFNHFVQTSQTNITLQLNWSAGGNAPTNFETEFINQNLVITIEDVPFDYLDHSW